MNADKKKLFFQFLIGALVGILAMFAYQKLNSENKNPESNLEIPSKISIENLTDEKIVIEFVKANKKLPENYITKNEARKKGWDPEKGNLCEVLPGKAIGGDYFSNREKSLPQGKYFEADVNYNCGNRNADRIIFNNNGDVWLTKDHYKTFVKK